MRQIIEGNARPSVADFHSHIAAFGDCPHGNGSPAGCVFDGIVQQIHEGLFQAMRVGADARQAGGRVEDECEAGRFGAVIQGRQGAFNHGSQVDSLHQRRRRL